MPQSKYFGNFNSTTINNMCGEIMFKHALVMAYQLNGSIYFSVEKFGITLKKSDKYICPKHTHVPKLLLRIVTCCIVVIIEYTI